MMEVSRKNPDNSGWTTHTIYTVQEANELGIPHKYWRDAQMGDEGKYFLSDDGLVGKCLSVRQYPRTRPDKAHPEALDRFVRTSVGRGVDNKWGKLVFSVPGQSGKNKQIKVKRIIAHLAAQFIMRGKRIDYQALGTIWRPHSPDLWKVRNVKRLISTEQMQTMIKDSVTKALADSTWSVGIVLERYDKLYQKASKSDQHLAKAVLDKLADILDMEPERQQVRMNANFNMGNTGEFLLPAGADEMDQLNAQASPRQLEQ